MNLCRIIFLLLLSSILIVSCKKDSGNFNADFGYAYLPLDSGNYVIYKADSITYDDFFNPVLIRTISFQIKEVVGEEFTDLSGRPSRKIFKYVRENSGDAWQLSQVNYATNTERVSEKVEDNQRYVKLVYPTDRNTKWKGNKYIVPALELSYLDGWEYRIALVNEPLTMGSLSFDSTLTVLEQYDSSAINLVSSVEKYATNVGMIYRELKVLEAQSNFNLPWDLRAEQGFIFRMQAIEYGKE